VRWFFSRRLDGFHLQYVSTDTSANFELRIFAALNGKITVGDSNATHDPFHTLVLSAAGQETGVSVSAVEGNTDFVLV
jgi:hypothetical protein